jgi:S1-C subfamily serine protease
MGLLQQMSEELESLVARTTPAVVAVEHEQGQGAGLVLAQDGFVLTNSHVVSGGRRRGDRRRGDVRVRLSGGRDLRGRVVGADPRTDLAVVRAEGSDLAPLPLARGRSLNVGQLVVAIGNPFRFERSVSLGVTSALDRFLPAPGGGALEGLIQTDAAINPGNSGGPLLNMRGEVVGINTAIIPYAQGIGFAIPAYTADWVTAVLIQRGTVERPYLGIAARSEELRTDVASVVGQARGVRVITVGNGTPAASAGLRDGDLLFALDGEAVHSVDDMQRIMVLSPRPEVQLAVWRNGERREVALRPRLQSSMAA